MSEPIIAVVGAGAVGGLLAALLDRAGVEVVAVARPETARAIEAEGITIQSRHFGDGVSRITAVTEIPDGANVILATKAFALPAVAGSLAHARPAEVISLLNGIEHLAILREDAPGALVAGASVAVESTRLSPTVIEHRSPFLRLTVPAHAAESGITAAWRTAGLDVTMGGTDQEVLWAKLRFLAPMALLTSYWRLPIGAALERDTALTTSLLAEVARVASLDGVPTDAGQLATALTALPPFMRSSLQNDLEAGQPSELDAIGGALARRGRSLGTDTSAVESLVADLTAR
ncbi:2-dehydropantoate 2-reductase [Cryobacterium adonitolivorans]|uniref:2-dehydropantoate 2-reductase n=1 Tax=Cryobacterium adonitolivorans TaxID=1259189 RepID=A0A4R8W3R9_9MICO|nr:2-dehydropantoate 2-reductase [Cryobacterium adonitolivorans]TFC01818.1 2-dehydropantoate 2-reductase [Cryobacterium adonitolivorans]